MIVRSKNDSHIKNSLYYLANDRFLKAIPSRCDCCENNPRKNLPIVESQFTSND